MTTPQTGIGRPPTISTAPSRSLKHHTSVLIKPTSSRCNLNCTYCFYLSKMEMYPWKDHPKLSLETFEAFVGEYTTLSSPLLSYIWQGGEPTIMGLPFFEEAVELQLRYSRKANPTSPPLVSNSMQTNATMLNDDWARFLKERNFLVGVSLDGPPELHDRHRRDWSDRGTFDRVMAGIDSLRGIDTTQRGRPRSIAADGSRRP